MGMHPVYDHYTTLRVKHAILRMNGDGLRNRLHAVEQKIQDLVRELRSTNESISGDWQPPAQCEHANQFSRRHASESNTVEAEDPNALCIPLQEDYAIP